MQQQRATPSPTPIPLLVSTTVVTCNKDALSSQLPACWWDLVLTVWAGGPGRVPAQSAGLRVGDHKHVGAASLRAGGLLGVGGRSLWLLGIWSLLLLLLGVVVMLLLRVPRVLELNNFDIIVHICT